MGLNTKVFHPILSGIIKQYRDYILTRRNERNEKVFK